MTSLILTSKEANYFRVKKWSCSYAYSRYSIHWLAYSTNKEILKDMSFLAQRIDRNIILDKED